jgi:hypothetical protein
MNHQAAKPKMRIGAAWLLSMALGTGALASTPPPAPKPAPAPMPVKPFRIIDTTCDVSSSEISPKGQLVCTYVCRDRDHTKLAVVYGNPGAAVCRTPVEKKIKQTIKDGP